MAISGNDSCIGSRKLKGSVEKKKKELIRGGNRVTRVRVVVLLDNIGAHYTMAAVFPIRPPTDQLASAVMQCPNTILSGPSLADTIRPSRFRWYDYELAATSRSSRSGCVVHALRRNEARWHKPHELLCRIALQQIDLISCDLANERLDLRGM
jgi:hypothetical protein